MNGQVLSGHLNWDRLPPKSHAAVPVYLSPERQTVCDRGPQQLFFLLFLSGNSNDLI